ncbi:MAG: serine/threonine protein kinase, partial [Verrucomicrobiaceae bacterium]
MTTVTHCLECGTELHATEASGLCPKCMLKLGLASQLASGTLPATAQGLRDDGTIVEPFDFGRYKVLRLLGKGGMGAVYEAEDHETQRRVALKVLGHSLDTAEMRARFLREGQIAASVFHPNVVGVFQAHEIEKTPVIAMELV